MDPWGTTRERFTLGLTPVSHWDQTLPHTDLRLLPHSSLHSVTPVVRPDSSPSSQISPSSRTPITHNDTDTVSRRRPRGRDRGAVPRSNVPKLNRSGTKDLQTSLWSDLHRPFRKKSTLIVNLVT